MYIFGGVKNAVYNNSALVERFNGQLFQPCYGMAVMLCLMLNLLEFQRFARRYANSPRRSSDGGGGGGSAAVVSPTSPSRPSSPPNRLPSSLNPEGSVFGWSGPGNIDDGGVRERRPPVRQVNLWRKMIGLNYAQHVSLTNLGWCAAPTCRALPVSLPFPCLPLPYPFSRAPAQMYTCTPAHHSAPGILHVLVVTSFFSKFGSFSYPYIFSPFLTLTTLPPLGYWCA